MTEDGTESDGDIKPDPQSHADRFQEPPPPTTAKQVFRDIVSTIFCLTIGPALFKLPFRFDFFEYQGIHAGRAMKLGVILVIAGALLSLCGLGFVLMYGSKIYFHFMSKEKDDNDDRRESKEEQ